MCADQEISKISGSGVTIGGNKTLEEWIDEEKDKETSEEILTKHTPLYNRPTGKFNSHKKGRSGAVRTFSRREINKGHWKEIIMEVNKSNLTKTAKMDQAILTVLLSGKEVSGVVMRNTVLKALPEAIKKSYDIRCTHLTKKTDLAKVLEIKRHGNTNNYRLVTAALDLTAEELHVFAYKRSYKRAEVLEKHKALQPYFPDEEKVEPVKKQKAKPFDPGTDVELESALKTDLSKKIEEALSSALGINVNVSGRIEIVFKIGG